MTCKKVKHCNVPEKNKSLVLQCIKKSFVHV